jgi:hypothetical protein
VRLESAEDERPVLIQRIGVRPSEIRSEVIQASVLKIFRGGRSTLNLWAGLRVLQQSNQLRTQSFATPGGNTVQSGQKKHHRRNSNCILSAFFMRVHGDRLNRCASGSGKILARF